MSQRKSFTISMRDELKNAANDALNKGKFPGSSSISDLVEICLTEALKKAGVLEAQQ